MTTELLTDEELKRMRDWDDGTLYAKLLRAYEALESGAMKLELEALATERAARDVAETGWHEQRERAQDLEQQNGVLLHELEQAESERDAALARVKELEDRLTAAELSEKRLEAGKEVLLSQWETADSLRRAAETALASARARIIELKSEQREWAKLHTKLCDEVYTERVANTSARDLLRTADETPQDLLTTQWRCMVRSWLTSHPASALGYAEPITADRRLSGTPGASTSKTCAECKAKDEAIGAAVAELEGGQRVARTWGAAARAVKILRAARKAGGS